MGIWRGVFFLCGRFVRYICQGGLNHSYNIASIRFREPKFWSGTSISKFAAAFIGFGVRCREIDVNSLLFFLSRSALWCSNDDAHNEVSQNSMLARFLRNNYLLVCHCCVNTHAQPSFIMRCSAKRKHAQWSPYKIQFHSVRLFGRFTGNSLDGSFLYFILFFFLFILFLSFSLYCFASLCRNRTSSARSSAYFIFVVVSFDDSFLDSMVFFHWFLVFSLILFAHPFFLSFSSNPSQVWRIFRSLVKPNMWFTAV